MNNTAQSALAAFLGAFSRLDLEAMLACFDQDASVFLPTEHHRARLDGKPNFSQAFEAVIARMRATGVTSMPLDADDLIVQEWGDTAVATFYLRKDHLSRRTFVFRRQGAEWRIVHLHASNAPLDA